MTETFSSTNLNDANKENAGLNEALISSHAKLDAASSLSDCLELRNKKLAQRLKETEQSSSGSEILTASLKNEVLKFRKKLSSAENDLQITQEKLAHDRSVHSKKVRSLNAQIKEEICSQNDLKLKSKQLETKRDTLLTQVEELRAKSLQTLKVLKVKNNELSLIKQNQSSLKKKVSKLENHLQDQRSEYDQEIEKLSAKIENCRSEIDLKTRQFDEVSLVNDILIEDKRSLDESLTKVRTQVSALTHQLNNNKGDDSKYKSRVCLLMKQKREFEELLDEKYERIGQMTAELKTTSATLEAQTQTNLEEVSLLKSTIETYKKKIEFLEDDFVNEQQRNKELREKLLHKSVSQPNDFELKKMHEDFQKLQKELQRIQSSETDQSKKDREKINNLEGKLNRVKHQLHVNETLLSQRSSHLEEYECKVSDKNRKIEEQNEDMNALKTQNVKLLNDLRSKKKLLKEKLAEVEAVSRTLEQRNNCTFKPKVEAKPECAFLENEQLHQIDQLKVDLSSSRLNESKFKTRYASTQKSNFRLQDNLNQLRQSYDKLQKRYVTEIPNLQNTTSDWNDLYSVPSPVSVVEDHLKSMDPFLKSKTDEQKLSELKFAEELWKEILLLDSDVNVKRD